VIVPGGEVDSPTIGQFASGPVEIPFQSLTQGAFDMMNPLKAVNITLRASQQEMNGNGDIVFVGVRAVFRGRPKTLTAGSIKKGSGTGTSIAIEWTYYLLEIDGKKVVEIDKLNSVFKVNGSDILAQSKRLC
jgi:P2 family phage contractile tail tube protein